MARTRADADSAVAAQDVALMRDALLAEARAHLRNVELLGDPAFIAAYRESEDELTERGRYSWEEVEQRLRAGAIRTHTAHEVRAALGRGPTT